jgi:hypothetical protein
MAEKSETLKQAIQSTTLKTGKYLLFTLDEEYYGIGII